MSTLEKLRISKGKTQEEMAKLLGIGVSTYSQYEKSQRTIPGEIKQKIVEILEIRHEEEIFLPVRFKVRKTKDKHTNKKSRGNWIELVKYVGYFQGMELWQAICHHDGHKTEGWALVGAETADFYDTDPRWLPEDELTNGYRLPGYMLGHRPEQG